MLHGTEGLMSAIASNKTSPEIISNYTKVVFKNNRLDILLGLKTKSFSEHEKMMALYPDLIRAANQYYDLVIIDLPKTGDRESTHKILNMSDVIMYTMAQNLKQINQYIEDKMTMPELSRKNVIPIIGSTNGYCKYNPKNIIQIIKDKNLAYINYNHVFLEVASEAKVTNLFLNTRFNKKVWDRNAQFLESVADSSQKIINKFEEIKYGKVMNS